MTTIVIKSDGVRIRINGKELKVKNAEQYNEVIDMAIEAMMAKI